MSSLNTHAAASSTTPCPESFQCIIVPFLGHQAAGWKKWGRRETGGPPSMQSREGRSRKWALQRRRKPLHTNERWEEERASPPLASPILVLSAVVQKWEGGTEETVEWRTTTMLRGEKRERKKGATSAASVPRSLKVK